MYAQRHIILRRKYDMEFQVQYNLQVLIMVTIVNIFKNSRSRGNNIIWNINSTFNNYNQNVILRYRSGYKLQNDTAGIKIKNKIN